METLVHTLLTWAVALSPYPMPSVEPIVELKPHEFFVENVCLGVERGCNFVGWYNDTGIIYIDERVNLDARDDIPFHEIIHYLQDLSGKFDTLDCEDRYAREREAYRIQNDFNFKAHGRLTLTQAPLMNCRPI